MEEGMVGAAFGMRVTGYRIVGRESAPGSKQPD